MRDHVLDLPLYLQGTAVARYDRQLLPWRPPRPCILQATLDDGSPYVEEIDEWLGSLNLEAFGDERPLRVRGRRVISARLILREAPTRPVA